MSNDVESSKYTFIEAVVGLKSGIEARVSYQLSKESSRYEGNIIIERKDESIPLDELLKNRTNSAKSIMTLLMLAAGKGSELNIYVEGDNLDARRTALRLKSGIENELEEKIVNFDRYELMPKNDWPQVQIINVN